MPIKKINIDEFLALAQTHVVFDVRSPGEHKQAHIPGANSLPLFSDEERAKVGTSYKQQNREAAIKIGLGFFGPKMRSIVEEVENAVKSFELRVPGSGFVQSGTALNSADPGIGNEVKAQPATHHSQSVTPISKPVTILLHCWRGGMRSAAVAWLLDMYGFRVYTLAGGYKRYRNWVLEQFSKEYPFTIIGGYTGSGKTVLLQRLAQAGHTIIDLEALANHKGSALGGLGKDTQPRVEMFENLLAVELNRKANAPVIFLEDESRRIGDVQIPMSLWYRMRKSSVLFLDIPFEERLNYITEEYGVQPKERLVNAVMRIQKRLGGLETKNAIGFLLEDNYKESFRILLKYYDKYYLNGLHNREDAAALIKKIPAEKPDPGSNTKLILQNSAVLSDQR